MAVNVWATVGGVAGYLPLSALTGSANQLLGMNNAATLAEWKALTFNSGTNQLAGPDGTAAAPLYSWTAELNMGIYRVSAGAFGGTIGGVRRFYINSVEHAFEVNARMLGKLIWEDKGADIAAAATTDLGNATGNFLTITNAAGATNVSSLGGATIQSGTEIETVLSITGGSITIVHNATDLICLGGANVACQDKDVIRWRKINDASAKWQMVSLQRGVNTGILTTAGDLLVGLGSGNSGRLGVGTDGMQLFASSDPAERMLWLSQAQGFNIVNGYLDYTVAANALTIALKGWNGADPSATNPVFIIFRDPTVTTGLPLIRKVTAATSIVVSSGSTLGARNSIPFRVWVVAFDDAGTVRLAAINCVTTVAGVGTGSDVTAIYPLKGWNIAGSTAEGGAGAADSAQIFYTGTAVAAKAYTVLGYATWEAGLAAAGTWGTAASRKHLWQTGTALPNDEIQRVRNDSGAVATGATILPIDDSIPQITEGDQYMVQAITPTSAANLLNPIFNMWVANNTAGAAGIVLALFRDATANALRAVTMIGEAAGRELPLKVDALILAESIATTTFKARAGANAASTNTFNGSGGGRIMGGVFNSYALVQEIMG